MIAATLALALAAGPTVAVDLLGKEAPRALVVRGDGAVRSVAARGDSLVVDGVPAAELSLPSGTWRVEPASGPARTYACALAIRAREGRLALRARCDLEAYVAAVVASEARPGTPAAALEALAVAVRSYALAARDRHPGGALCDLAHCQLLRGAASPRHLARAARAARATRGEVLVLPSGAIAAAAFHASCGGRTAEPREAFGSDASGGRSAEDGCVGPAWQAALSPARVAGAARAALSGSAPGVVPASLRAADLVLSRGAGGWVSRVEAADGSWRVSGDAFARALDATVGRGVVRSGRFEVADEDGRVVLRGTGHGHGVGLCQEGAARLAAAGADRRDLLGRYYRARITTLRESGP